jgi:hypothetical protein
VYITSRDHSVFVAGQLGVDFGLHLDQRMSTHESTQVTQSLRGYMQES